MSTDSLNVLAEEIKAWGQALGFQQTGVSDLAINQHRKYLQRWLDKGYHGEMEWMRKHQALRNDPKLVVEGALRVICFRMDYFPAETNTIKLLNDTRKAYLSRYALGRDYHKVLRKRLSKLAKRIEIRGEELKIENRIKQRPFVDSAPILEKAYAEKAGLGWIGKNTLLLNRKAGSWFFLGELITNLPLPIDTASTSSHCGSCNACMDVCPTKAFVAPYQLDARRCISYLTIELKGSIPEEFRKPMGNRVFGCDDCQLVCPWNKFSKPSLEPDFSPRHGLDNADLLTLFLWTENEFLDKTAGSPIRRIGYERWSRNLAVALGNSSPSSRTLAALNKRREQSSLLVREHIDWAIHQQTMISNKQ